MPLALLGLGGVPDQEIAHTAAGAGVAGAGGNAAGNGYEAVGAVGQQ